jgi:hypothetical protein
MRILVGLAVLVLASFPSVGSAAPVDEVAVATAAQAGDLIIQSDMAIGAPGPCALQSRFAPGDRVVFRAKVFDAHTGQEVRDGTVTVILDNGTTVPMRYANHPPPNVGPSTDEYWVGVWAIRPDAPMGIVRYTIEAAADGRTGTFVPFDNATTLLTIVPASS